MGPKKVMEKNDTLENQQKIKIQQQQQQQNA